MGTGRVEMGHIELGYKIATLNEATASKSKRSKPQMLGNSNVAHGTAILGFFVTIRT